MVAPVYATVDDLTASAMSPEALKRTDPAAIEVALSQASRTADIYLGQRYALPLVSWGDDLRQIVAQIAAFRLMSRRGWNPEDRANVGMVTLYKEALATLKAVSVGNATLSVVDTSPEPSFEPDLQTSEPRGY